MASRKRRQMFAAKAHSDHINKNQFASAYSKVCYHFQSHMEQLYTLFGRLKNENIQKMQPIRHNMQKDTTRIDTAARYTNTTATEQYNLLKQYSKNLEKITLKSSPITMRDRASAM